jgi:hypothetical protein
MNTVKRYTVLMHTIFSYYSRLKDMIFFVTKKPNKMAFVHGVSCYYNMKQMAIEMSELKGKKE